MKDRTLHRMEPFGRSAALVREIPYPAAGAFTAPCSSRESRARTTSPSCPWPRSAPLRPGRNDRLPRGGACRRRSFAPAPPRRRHVKWRRAAPPVRGGGADPASPGKCRQSSWSESPATVPQAACRAYERVDRGVLHVFAFMKSSPLRTIQRQGRAGVDFRGRARSEVLYGSSGNDLCNCARISSSRERSICRRDRSTRAAPASSSSAIPST